MAVTYTGLAVAWGAKNLETAGVVVGVAEGQTQSWNGTIEADIADLLNGDGETVGRGFTAKKRSITITVMPCDKQTTRVLATAKANLNLFLKAPGSTVTIGDVDMVGSVWEDKHTGKWYLMSSKVTRSNNGPAMIEMSLIQYEDYDITVATS